MKVSLYFIAIAGVFFSCNQTPNSSPKTETLNANIITKAKIGINASQIENYYWETGTQKIGDCSQRKI